MQKLLTNIRKSLSGDVEFVLPEHKLLYDKEKHGLQEPKNQKHLTQKIFSWFEYYLK